MAADTMIAITTGVDLGITRIANKHSNQSVGAGLPAKASLKRA
jgi:hypothetical protein